MKRMKSKLWIPIQLMLLLLLSRRRRPLHDRWRTTKTPAKRIPHLVVHRMYQLASHGAEIEVFVFQGSAPVVVFRCKLYSVSCCDVKKKKIRQHNKIGTLDLGVAMQKTSYIHASILSTYPRFHRSRHSYSKASIVFYQNTHSSLE